MSEKLIGYARLVSIAATQGHLTTEQALLFCRDAVPQLLAEIEVLGRVSARFEQALTLTTPPASTPSCEATICSSRWSPVEEPPSSPKKPRKAKRAKKARRK